MSTTKRSFWSRTLDVLQFLAFAAFIVFLSLEGNYVAALGWFFAAYAFYSTQKEHEYYQQIYDMYLEHLNKCEKRDIAYQKQIADYKIRLAKSNDAERSAVFDVEKLDIDHILKIGRDWQKSDTWRGATHDTAKLLCDTIEMLRDKLDKEGK